MSGVLMRGIRALGARLEAKLRNAGPRVYIHGKWPVGKPWGRAALQVYSVGKGLGDELMATPTLRELKRRNEKCHVTYIARRPELFRGQPWCDEVVLYDKDRLGGAIPLHYNCGFPPPRPMPFLIAECLGLLIKDLVPSFTAPPVDADFVKAVASIPRPRVVLQPLASDWTPNKDWGLAKWDQLVEKLVESTQVLETGVSTVLKAPSRNGERYHSFGGKTNLAQFIHLIQNADAFIGPPSGGMHLAAGLEIPSVIIYGGYERASSCVYPKVRGLEGRTPCSPCWLETPCPYNRECLAMIGVDDVFSAAMEQLEKYKGSESKKIEVK